MVPWDSHGRLTYDKKSPLYKLFYPVLGGPVDTNFYVDYLFRDSAVFNERNRRLWALLNDKQLTSEIDSFFIDTYEKIRFELSLTPRYDFHWGKEVIAFENLDNRMKNLSREYKNYAKQTADILAKSAHSIEAVIVEEEDILEIQFKRNDSASELSSTELEIVLPHYELRFNLEKAELIFNDPGNEFSFTATDRNSARTK